MTLKTIEQLFCATSKRCASFRSHLWIQTGGTVRKCSIRVKIVLINGWPWKKRTPLLSYFKLCASFGSHLWVKTGVTVAKRFLSHVTLKFDEWHWKIMRHLFYATPSFVHDFVAIDEFSLKLQSGDTQFGWTLFGIWPRELADDLKKQRITSPRPHHVFIAIWEFKTE